MCDVVQTNGLLCHLGKDYEIKSVLTSSVLESYKHILGKMFPFSKHFFKFIVQASETPENFHCLVKLRVA